MTAETTGVKRGGAAVAYICKVVIIGGGTAGWMTAAYLGRCLKDAVDIKVLESPDIPTVGVGEATFSTIRLYFDYLGLSEDEWMRQCNASYKLAIRFVDWNAERRHFYHPFQRFETIEGRRACEWWLKLHRYIKAPFDYACFTVPAICDAKRAPRFANGHLFDARADAYLSTSGGERATSLEDLQIQYPYAYHLDAGLFAKFLSRYAQVYGARQITDEVCGVCLDEKGFITAVETRGHGSIEGDLFIDCTGFRGLLVNQAMNEPFISFTESLPCDSAVATQIPGHPEANGINPYTTATALSAGWVWNIPLFCRIGTGYVYSSAFLSQQDAEREFRQHLGPQASGCEAKHIKMRVGRNRNSWVRNCVAIGLSSGFVEPLESTGIFFIQHAIEQLVAHFPHRRIEEDVVKCYNQSVADCIDGVREFLTLHYVASSRTDSPFWKATKRDLVVPADLAERLRLWKKRLPTNRTINPRYHGFESYSYAVMLLGLGYRPERSLPLLDYMDNAEAHAMFESIQHRSKQLVETLPSVREYLAIQHQEAAA